MGGQREAQTDHNIFEPILNAKRKQAIPPTLRRLERAAMRWFGNWGRTWNPPDKEDGWEQEVIDLHRACARHAAAQNVKERK